MLTKNLAEYFHLIFSPAPNFATVEISGNRLYARASQQQQQQQQQTRQLTSWAIKQPNRCLIQSGVAPLYTLPVMDTVNSPPIPLKPAADADGRAVEGERRHARVAHHLAIADEI
jgi:hypothetical protein